jgi:hypothetical protein
MLILIHNSSLYRTNVNEMNLINIESYIFSCDLTNFMEQTCAIINPKLTKLKMFFIKNNISVIFK